MARRTGKVSIQDIAALAQVSTATVSRAMNGYQHIAADKRERVLKVIKDLQYEPSSIARDLRASQTRRIMVTAINLSSPVVDELFRGMERRATEGRYKVFFAPSSRDNEREVQLIDQVIKGVFDGAVLFGTTLTPSDLERTAKRCNIVQCSEFTPARVAGCSIDDVSAARDVVAHLIARGHKSIAILRNSHEFSGRSRERGYRSALADAGLPVDDEIVLECDYTYEAGLAQGGFIIGRHPDVSAIFCTSDLMALGCMNAARRAGRAVPAQLAVVGFDGTVESTMCDPQITTVSQPHSDIGYSSMDILIKSIESGRRSFRHVFLPYALTIRGSV